MTIIEENKNNEQLKTLKLFNGIYGVGPIISQNW